MKIPKNPEERYKFYLETMAKCFSTCDERRGYYNVLRNYVAEGGGQDSAFPVFNNLGAHLDLLKSMLYAQDTTRFSVEVGATESGAVYDKTEITARRVQQEWHDSNCDIVFGQAIFESFASASAIVKLVWNKGLHPYVVSAERFGVLRENIGMLDRQQAVGEKYEVTLEFLATMLQDHPRGKDILEKVTSNHNLQDEERTGYTNLFISASQPNLIGNVAMPSGTAIEPQPRVDADMVLMTDLYVWDDDLCDFQVVTMADPGIVIFDRPLGDMFLKGELPYIKICPNPKSKNFWGEAEAGKLRPLQDWLNERLYEIRLMLNRQARPPKVGSGLFGDESEISRALTTPDTFTAGDQGYNLQELKPQIPEDLFRDVTNIMEMFNQVSGLSNILQGRGEAGVRSNEHANTLGKFSSSRIKNRALVIEDSLEQAATKILNIMRKFSDDVLTDTKGQPFALAQLPKALQMKVDAHSNSPAFVDELFDRSVAMLNLGLLDSDGFFDLTNPPQKDMLKKRARDMHEAKAKSAAEAQKHDDAMQLAIHGKLPHPQGAVRH